MKKKSIIMIFLLLFLVLLGINGTMLFLYWNNPSAKADKLLIKGQDYLEDEKYDEAVQTYKEVLAENDMNVEAYQGLAQAYKASGEIKKARDTMEKGYRLTKDEALAGEITMITWEEAGKKDRAIEWEDNGVEEAVRSMTGIDKGDIMLSDIWEISDFYLYESQITDLSDLKDLPNITSLSLYGCQITDLAMLKDFAHLEELHLSDNEITDLQPLSHLTNLIFLDVSNNRIENAEPLKKLKNLTYLDISGNGITEIEALENLSDLEYLSMNGNPISDLSPIRKMKELTTLYLENMQISDISILSSMKNLTRLSLAGNYYIEDFTPLEELSELCELDLSYTKISDLSILENLRKLTYLNIAETYISDMTPAAHVEYLKKQ